MFLRVLIIADFADSPASIRLKNTEVPRRNNIPQKIYSPQSNKAYSGIITFCH